MTSTQNEASFVAVMEKISRFLEGNGTPERLYFSQKNNAEYNRYNKTNNKEQIIYLALGTV